MRTCARLAVGLCTGRWAGAGVMGSQDEEPGRGGSADAGEKQDRDGGNFGTVVGIKMRHPSGCGDGQGGRGRPSGMADPADPPWGYITNSLRGSGLRGVSAGLLRTAQERPRPLSSIIPGHPPWEATGRVSHLYADACRKNHPKQSQTPPKMATRGTDPSPTPVPGGAYRALPCDRYRLGRCAPSPSQGGTKLLHNFVFRPSAPPGNGLRSQIRA